MVLGLSHEISLCPNTLSQEEVGIPRISDIETEELLKVDILLDRVSDIITVLENVFGHQLDIIISEESCHLLFCLA